MIGKYVAENFDKLDLNGDGKISYVMFKGQEGNMEAIARTQYGVEDANTDPDRGTARRAWSSTIGSNSNKYLVDQNGQWSAQRCQRLYDDAACARTARATTTWWSWSSPTTTIWRLALSPALQSSRLQQRQRQDHLRVFGVDATEAGKDAIKSGIMIGTIKQDAEGMANGHHHHHGQLHHRKEHAERTGQVRCGRNLACQHSLRDLPRLIG